MKVFLIDKQLTSLVKQSHCGLRFTGGYRANGVRFSPSEISKGASDIEICPVHPKANDEFPIAGEAVLIELVQAQSKVHEILKRLG